MGLDRTWIEPCCMFSEKIMVIFCRGDGGDIWIIGLGIYFLGKMGLKSVGPFLSVL